MPGELTPAACRAATCPGTDHGNPASDPGNPAARPRYLPRRIPAPSKALSGVLRR
jgi:hypothetical protein